MGAEIRDGNARKHIPYIMLSSRKSRWGSVSAFVVVAAARQTTAPGTQRQATAPIQAGSIVSPWVRIFPACLSSSRAECVAAGLVPHRFLRSCSEALP